MVGVLRVVSIQLMDTVSKYVAMELLVIRVQMATQRFVISILTQRIIQI
jgi:hypothetical protein